MYVDILVKIIIIVAQLLFMLFFDHPFLLLSLIVLVVHKEHDSHGKDVHKKVRKASHRIITTYSIIVEKQGLTAKV